MGVKHNPVKLSAKQMPDWRNRTFLPSFNELAYCGLGIKQRLGKHILDIEKTDSTYWKVFSQIKDSKGLIIKMESLAIEWKKSAKSIFDLLG